MPAAIKAFEWLTELHPNSLTGLGNLAFSYTMSGQNDKATGLAQKALKSLETDKTLSEDQKAQGRQQIQSLLKQLQASPAK